MVIYGQNCVGKRSPTDEVFGFESRPQNDCVPDGVEVDLDVFQQNTFPSPNYESDLDHSLKGMDPYLSPRAEETMDITEFERSTQRSPSVHSDTQEVDVLGLGTVSFDELLDGNYGVPSVTDDKDATDDDIDIEIQKYLDQESKNPVDSKFVEELFDEGDVEENGKDEESSEEKPTIQTESAFTNVNTRRTNPVRSTRNTIVIQGGTPLPSTKDCKQSNIIVVRPTTAVRPTATTRATVSASVVAVPPKHLPEREAKRKNTRMFSPVPSVSSYPSSSDINEDKSNRNAIQARINRQKKKAYISGLEKQVSTLSKENEQLQSSSAKLRKNMESLEQELSYLRNVLANDSVLADMLGNLNNGLNLSLTTSFKNDRKRSSSDMDHDYGRPSKGRKTESNAMSGGVCLHVENQNVSLEFCSKCARMAREREP